MSSTSAWDANTKPNSVSTWARSLRCCALGWFDALAAIVAASDTGTGTLKNPLVYSPCLVGSLVPECESAGTLSLELTAGDLRRAMKPHHGRPILQAVGCGRVIETHQN